MGVGAAVKGATVLGWAEAEGRETVVDSAERVGAAAEMVGAQAREASLVAGELRTLPPTRRVGSRSLRTKPGTARIGHLHTGWASSSLLRQRRNQRCQNRRRRILRRQCIANPRCTRMYCRIGQRKGCCTRPLTCST